MRAPLTQMLRDEELCNEDVGSILTSVWYTFVVALIRRPKLSQLSLGFLMTSKDVIETYGLTYN